MELVLHNVSGKTENGAGFEERDYREGYAKAHFSAEGWRLTGNPQIAGAPSVLIIGDSHVEAYSVPDRETMGSILERRLRAEGKPWNVLQYGWRGADGPDYVYQAALVRDQFHPDWIFLVTTKGDFGSTSTEYARLVEKDGAVVAEPAQPGAKPGRPASYGSSTARRMKESGLLYASVVRFRLEILPAILGQKTGEEKEYVASTQAVQNNVELIVRGLRDGYGKKLKVLYAPEQPFSAEAPLEAPEAVLPSACEEFGLDCRDLRASMIEDLLTHHKVDRGAVNTTPGWGHFNANGHELVAAQIDEWLLNISR
jgi:lysophospholipase L1-like esterase